MQASSTPSCYKHGRPFELIGNDSRCELPCQICCDCLRGVDHGHKKDIVNHQTISIEQLSQHFEQIQKFNHQSLMECGQAIDRYFRTIESMLRDQLSRQRQRMNKFARKIMLTEIVKQDKKLSTITALYQKEFTGIRCKDVGEISKELFSYQPKNSSIGYRKFVQYLSARQMRISDDFKDIITGKPYQNIVLKKCEQQLLFPHFQKPNLQISRVKSEEKQSPKKTIRRSIKKTDRSINDLKQFNIQLKKPIDFTGSKLVTSKDQTQFIIKCFENRHPVNAKLMYRASENNFSVKAFHQMCDNEADTIVFIQTEFGKIIGGYTPIPWKSTANTLHSDVKLESFLFSISLKQKMSLLDEKSATFNSINFGPTFGAGADLAICHNGNIQKTSYSEFPYSYANPRYKENNQHSTALFTGQKNGNHFLLKQWQVWKVEFPY